MNKQIALSIEQMNNLVSLGVDTSQASMCWVEMPTANAILNDTEETEWSLFVNEDMYPSNVPAFTLEDILEILPRSIKEDYYLSIIKEKNAWNIYYRTPSPFAFLKAVQNREDKSLLQAAYEMLLWIIENKLLKQ